ncbi:unnamed protein product [Meganyctiphanes norvegica]|uniref:AB hydrolase-1 domain-containing protein n=1 Tax=Meganyctiphanes norvegica TaxID=48144 RepID=A0AAV2PFQ9_MEGNR
MIKRFIYAAFLAALWHWGIELKTVLLGGFLVLLVTYTVVPLFYHYNGWLQRHLVFLTFVNYPKGIDFDKPENEGLPGTRNFYVETEDNIRVGVWHILPASLIDTAEAAENRTEFFNNSLCDDRPVLLYLHGNTASRAVPHRVELYKLLRKMDYHVVAFDYRGYADSSKVVPTETGIVHDACVVYRYVKERVGTSPLVVWGHSLGTGVSCHAVSHMCLSGEPPTALILESPFNNIKDEIRYHPLTSIFRKMPKFEWLFLTPLSSNGIDFRSDEHIAHINTPILILHAEDDLVVPYMLGHKLYEVAKKIRPKDADLIQFKGFESKHGYAHKFIYMAPELPQIIRQFFNEAKIKIDSSN